MPLLPDRDAVIALRPDLAAEPGLLSDLALFALDSEVEIPPSDIRTLIVHEVPLRSASAQGSSMRETALRLIDAFPEVSGSLGMLRCYLVPEEFLWSDLERAEDLMGASLTTNPYGWKPDGFTLRREAKRTVFELRVIYADG